jgi:hypothetical protein
MGWGWGGERQTISAKISFQKPLQYNSLKNTINHDTNSDKHNFSLYHYVHRNSRDSLPAFYPEYLGPFF